MLILINELCHPSLTPRVESSALTTLTPPNHPVSKCSPSSRYHPFPRYREIARRNSAHTNALRGKRREKRLPSEAGLEGERERGWCLKKIAFQMFPRRTYSVRINGRSTQRGAKQVSRHRARSGRRRCATSPTTTSLARTVGSRGGVHRYRKREKNCICIMFIG